MQEPLARQCAALAERRATLCVRDAEMSSLQVAACSRLNFRDFVGGILCLSSSMPSLPVSSGSSAGLAFNKATQAFHQHKAIVASSLTSASSSESQHVSMATMFLIALSCVAAVVLLVYLVRCLINMCSDDTFQKALDADRCLQSAFIPPVHFL
jgi:hypothetical protein